MNLQQKAGFRAAMLAAHREENKLRAHAREMLRACKLARQYIKERTLCAACREKGTTCPEHLPLWAKACDALDRVIAEAEPPTTYIEPGDCAAHEVTP